jgi:hypothetical protein
MKFAFLGYSLEQKWNAMSKTEQDAMVDDCFTYNRKLFKDGHLIGDGLALQTSRTARTLRWQNGAVVVTDGPFAETKEQLGGIGILEARDMDHAVELLSKHPGLHYIATFEIRPINEESLQCQAASMNALRGSAPAVDPRAMQFASLGYINEDGWASISKDERDAMLARCVAFDEARVKSGQWLKGIGLQKARSARTLRARAGKVIVTDGPFAETKESLGGVVVLALTDTNAALALLSKHPALPFGVTIELRPIHAEINKRWETQVTWSAPLGISVPAG